MVLSPLSPSPSQNAKYPIHRHVIHSTLPLWKNKTDVSITYTPKTASTPIQFLDQVSYTTQGSSDTSTITGTDTQLANHPTRFKWRGKGWLMIASSRWQLLGYSLGIIQDLNDHPAWAVTYFEKTLFTPAGMDIYSRSPEGLPAPLLDEIFAKITGLGGDISILAQGFFEVERTRITF